MGPASGRKFTALFVSIPDRISPNVAFKLYLFHFSKYFAKLFKLQGIKR